jgi:hypothetical protein
MRAAVWSHRTWSRALRYTALLCCGVLACHSGRTAPLDDSARVATYAAELARSLSAKERAVLEQIPDSERRLLALRAYVKAGRQLDARWSWTRDEIERYSQSQEYARLLEDLAAVKGAFERANPGFTLYANTEARSLDAQIERWNANPHVGATARNLRTAAAASLAKAPAMPTQDALQAFKRFLESWRPSPVAPLAAPGLSLHGRMRAIDFQIMRGPDIVAATDIAAAAREWDAPGWTHKLQRAVRAAGARFAGPLQSPHEPWHYEYQGAQPMRP